MLLKDRVVIITGGAGFNGLGFATARMMAEHGARVAILDLESANPAGAAAELGSDHIGLVANVTSEEQCDAAAAAPGEASPPIQDLLRPSTVCTLSRLSLLFGTARQCALMESPASPNGSTRRPCSKPASSRNRNCKPMAATTAACAAPAGKNPESLMR